MKMVRPFLYCVSTAALIGLVPGTLAAAPQRCLRDKTCADFARQAQQASSSKDWQTARTWFEKAYSQVPEPELLLNIGRCWHYLGHCEQAQKRYGEYRQLVPQPEAEPGALLQIFEREAAACRKTPATAPAQDGAAPPGASVTVVQALPAGSVIATERGVRPALPARGLHKRWWFWTLIGTAAAGTAAGLAAGLAIRQEQPSGSDVPYAGPTISLTFGVRP